MAALTRLTLDAYGGKRAGSFADKTPDATPTHPVGRITRMSLDAYGARRAGDFSGKTMSADEVSIRLFPLLGVGF